MVLLCDVQACSRLHTPATRKQVHDYSSNTTLVTQQRHTQARQRGKQPLLQNQNQTKHASTRTNLRLALSHHTRCPARHSSSKLPACSSRCATPHDAPAPAPSYLHSSSYSWLLVILWLPPETSCVLHVCGSCLGQSSPALPGTRHQRHLQRQTQNGVEHLERCHLHRVHHTASP
jgi:hypothetical protein